MAQGLTEMFVPSEKQEKKADTAKKIIENMYRLQETSLKDRHERCVLQCKA